MNFSKFTERLHHILKDPLPAWESVVDEGREIARSVHMGRTAFMEKFGVNSESEYKRQCIKDGTIAFHAHIGMSTWHATAKALRRLHQAAEENGFLIDRAGICLDRRMALPEDMRQRVPSETGPMLKSEADWYQVGQCAPIQPHMGDFMIGFPASTINTIHALAAGITTIGNLSQFFAHEAPLWKDTKATTIETVRAISILGALRKRGVVLHSYLEDGFGGLFNDCATIAGWAFLERYIVEDLMDCKLVHCIGGLTSDPVKRAGWVFALNDIHEGHCLGSMIYGDTISLTNDFTVNQAVIGEYLLWDIMAQIECPTGHAVLPLPVTEALRVPSVEEIVKAHKFGRKVESAARRLHPHVDFGSAYEFSDKVVFEGRAIFKRALDGLKGEGVDIRNPVQMLYILKKIGPTLFEETFSRMTGEGAEEGLEWLEPTDVFRMTKRCIDENRNFFLKPAISTSFKGRRLLLASTDVHQNAIMILDQLLSLSGAVVSNMGAENDPEEVAFRAIKEGVEAILVSTHNGNALEYAHSLKEALGIKGAAIPVIMGGRLNQNIESEPLPVDVSNELKTLGFIPCKQIDQPFHRMIAWGD